MKKLKKFLFAAFTVAILSCLLCQPAFAAISESDVQAQVDAVGKEAVSGNVFIWFLCAIGFLKVGQKIDSFLSSLGVNVGHTGGSMLAEAMIAARGIGGIKNFSSHHFGGGRNSSSTNVNANGGKGSGGFGAGFASGGLAGVVSRKVTNSAIKTATTTPGSKPSGLGSLLGDAAAGGIGGHMYASSVSKGGNFANNVIGSVATGSISQMGSISGEKAAEALHSYMGYAALESGAENVPTFQNVEIGGGRITGTEVTAEHPEGISFGIRKTKRIQEELVRVPDFAALYGALCRQEIGDEEIASALESADGYGERLTAYPQEQVLAVMKLELLPSLRFEYLKYYFPFVMYEEEEQVILDNLQTFPIAEWKGLSMLTEHQRDMMRQPFLGSYLFCWHQNEREALELLEQNCPLQRVCILLYRYGVRLFLSVERLKDLRWMKMTDVGKFRRLLAVFEYDAEDLSAFFGLWLDNHAGQYDLNWFISQPHPLSKEQREEILCNQLSYLNALYAGRLHLDFNAVRQFQFSILIYAVEHRKKHFLELVDQNSEVFLSLGRYSLLFEPGFCEHCNINSLTLKNLKASDSVNRSDSFFTLLEEGQQYTFEEMYQLWHQKEVYVRLYTMLTPLSIDQRLLTLRQLIKRDLVSQYTGDAELEQLGKCLLERPFSEWYRGSFGHICGLTRRIAMGLLQHYTQLQAFIPDFTTESDAVFTLNNMTALLERTDWKQVRKDILTTDADWLDLKEKLAFSDDFVEQNRETVTEFLLQGGAAMVRALYGELDGQELAVEALRRIVQAELMGQFYKLKYFAGDLQREIRYPVSEMQESLWKKNLSLARGAFWAEEVDDFYHTLRLGELPHSTCLSYRTGSQRECLLAAFDSNKKIVLVKKDEAVVARACLRLTKGAFQKPPAVDFSFADLSQENMDIGKPVTSEKPVLFLESIYTFGLNDIEKEEVMKLAVSLTTQKAAELGVVAVLARRYLGCYERDEYVLAPFYVYISKSKNGWQYLDSLGGAAYTSAKEEYVEHPFLVIQTAMHHAGAHNRNEVDYE